MICHVVHYLSGDESTWGVLHGGRGKVQFIKEQDACPFTGKLFWRGPPCQLTVLGQYR